MKKFWTLLALVAVTLNFSSVSLWAQELNKPASDEETALEVAAVADEEKSEAVVDEKAEEAATTAVTSATSAEKAAVPAVSEEEKKDETEPTVPETTQGEDKVS